MFKALALFVAGASAEFADTPVLTDFWKAISSSSQTDLEKLLFREKETGELGRASDGRGPLWWAWEYGNADALAALKVYYDVDLKTTEEDLNGATPSSLYKEDVDELVKKAEGLVAEVTERQAALQKEKDLDDDDDLDTPSIPTTSGIDDDDL